MKLRVSNIEWNTEIDPDMVTKLKTAAGVPQ